MRKLTGPLHQMKETIAAVVLDTVDWLCRRRDPLTPPRRLLYDGPRDPSVYLENGREFLSHYRSLCGLGPDEHVLDVGSGMGRKTVPLTGYLSPRAIYVGLDVNPRGVAWCRTRISSRHANFRFQHIDVFNRRYNPRGRCRDADFEFPFPDESFDFVVLASVFTHMMPAGVARYLQETARVLRRGRGRCLISFFLLNAESEVSIASSQSAFGFAHRFAHHAVEKPDRPEDVVAYDEVFVRQIYAEANMEITGVYPGSWRGREGCQSFQDLIVASVGVRAPR